MLNKALALLNHFLQKYWFTLNIPGALQGQTPHSANCQICKGEKRGSETETLLITQSTFYSKWK